MELERHTRFVVLSSKPCRVKQLSGTLGTSFVSESFVLMKKYLWRCAVFSTLFNALESSRSFISRVFNEMIELC